MGADASHACDSFFVIILCLIAGVFFLLLGGSGHTQAFFLEVPVGGARVGDRKDSEEGWAVDVKIYQDNARGHTVWLSASISRSI